MELTKNYPLQKSVISFIAGLGIFALALINIARVLSIGMSVTIYDPLLLILSIWLISSHEIVWNRLKNRLLKRAIGLLGPIVISYSILIVLSLLRSGAIAS